MVKFFRLDDRLIHGQIVTAWINYLNTKSIIVADDKSANDSLSRTLFELAIPKGIHLRILSVKDAIEVLNSLQDDIMLICGSINSAKELINGTKLAELNIGNINPTKNRQKIALSLWLSDEDKSDLKNLIESGIDVYYQTVPTEKKIRLSELIK